MRFSGHESFHCRHFWLKKGYDFFSNGDNMNSPEAPSKLGVGKNMVASINYWMQAFGLKDSNNELSKIADYLFGEKGKDPYLEDLGTLWILQFLLVKTNLASIYSYVFTDFIKKHLNAEFTLDQINEDIRRLLLKEGISISPTTIEKDSKVFLRTYFLDSNSKLNEDDLSSLLIDLNLIERVDVNTFCISINEKLEIPIEIFSFLILFMFEDQDGDVSVSFDDLQQSLADPLGCNRSGLEHHIQLLQESYNWIVYKEDAGRREVQLKSNKPNAFEILDEYYDRTF